MVSNDLISLRNFLAQPFDDIGTMCEEVTLYVENLRGLDERADFR